MLRAIIASICFISAGAAIAKGAHSSDADVSGNTGAKSAEVAPYDRAASGHAVQGSAVGNSSGRMVGGGTLPLDDPMSFGGVGKQSATGARAPCEYKAVMTDDEIATCRATQNAAVRKSARRRK